MAEDAADDDDGRSSLSSLSLECYVFRRPKKLLRDEEKGKGMPGTIEITKTFSNSSWDHSGGSDEDSVVPTPASKGEENGLEVAAGNDETDDARQDQCNPHETAWFSLEMIVCMAILAALVLFVWYVWNLDGNPSLFEETKELDDDSSISSQIFGYND